MSAATTTTDGEIVLAGDFTGDANFPELRASGVTPGTYGPVQRISIDNKGRTTSVGQMTSAEITAAVGDATAIAKGVVQVGSNISVSSGSISIPNATTSVKGVFSVVSPLIATSGVISIDVTALADATLSTKGIMQVGSGLSIASGVLSRAGAGDATTSSKGIVQIDTSNGLGIASGVLSFTPTDATALAKGVVQIGTNISLSSGTISIADAAVGVKGVVQVGSNITISSGSISIPLATGSVKGVMQVGGGLSVVNGKVSLFIGTVGTPGLVQVGSGLSITGGGILSLDAIPDATTSSKGLVQIASSNALTVSTGIISLADATNSVLGKASTSNSSNITFSSGLMNLGANIPKLDTANTYTKANAAALVTPSYAASYAPDLSTSNTIEMTLTGNVSLQNPTNAVAGGVYSIILTQDGTGSRTLTVAGSAYKTNQTLTLSTAAGKRDVLTMICKSTSEIYLMLTPGF